MMLRRLRNGRFIWLIIAALIVGSGCNDGSGYRVSGTVVFQGRPVPAGTIYFHPNKAAGNEGPSGFAQIVDGNFDTAARRGRGVIAGSHKVEISGYEPATPSAENPEGGGVSLFAGYREVIEFPAAASRHEFVVPDDAAKNRGN
jgi:hypothetical protein